MSTLIWKDEVSNFVWRTADLIAFEIERYLSNISRTLILNFEF